MQISGIKLNFSRHLNADKMLAETKKTLISMVIQIRWMIHLITMLGNQVSPFQVDNETLSVVQLTHISHTASLSMTTWTVRERRLTCAARFYKSN